MTDSSFNHIYSDAVKHIGENFHFPTIPTYVVCPAEDHPARFVAAKHMRTIGFATKHYVRKWMMPSTLNPQDDFVDLLNKDAVISISDRFRIDNPEPAEYLAVLFQHFVNDGYITPNSIAEVKIGEHPTAVFSEHIIKQYKQECVLYNQPTASFLREYPNWKKTGDIRFSDNHQTYTVPEITENNLFLNDILKKEYVTPLLQNLIKLRIIHLCLSQIDNPSLQQHAFFQHASLKNALSTLQQDIQEKIHAITALSFEERQAKALVENSANHYGLSPIVQKLAQHISFAKLINGHAFYDIHQLSNSQLPLSKKLKFYLKSYTNSSIIEYIATRSYKNVNKSLKTVRLFITGQEKIKTIPFAFFNLLKSIYLAVWLPFLATYFVTSGLTSVPFSLLRKTVGISFGGKWDKALTGFEALKDMALLYIGLPLAYSLLTTVGISLLGASALSFGSAAGFYSGLAIVSPFLLFGLPDHFRFTPGWYITNGVTHYIGESYNTILINAIKAASVNSFVAIHLTLASITLIIFSTVSIAGYTLNKAKEFFAPNKQCQRNDLMVHNRNINHSQSFRKTLGELIKKLDDNSCKAEDIELLQSLFKSQLDSAKKPLIIDYLNQKISEKNTPNKNVFTIANSQLKQNGAFLPSWKLINRLNTELAQEKGTNPELRNEVGRVYKLYTGPLAAYQ